MAKQNTNTEITVDPITGWPSAVPEMAELERAAEAAHSRHATMTERLAAAQREVQAGVAKRDALVERTRAEGCATNPGMILPGMMAIGVPIRTRRERVAGALSIAAIEGRMQPDRRARLAEWMREEAAAIAARLDAP